VTLKARYPSFKTLTRSNTLPFSTNVGVRFYGAARELLERVPAGPLRLLGLMVSNLEDVREPHQGLLFGSVVAEAPLTPEPSRRTFGGDRLERVSPGLDRLRRKYGRNVVVPASLIGREEATGRDGTTSASGARVRDLDEE
jgi:DNA polymerase-4